MKIHRTTILAGACAAFAVLAACNGVIGDGGSSGKGGPGGAAAGGASGGHAATADAFPCTTDTASSAPTPMLMLSRAQYVNTLKALFGATTPDVSGALGPDSSTQITDGQVAQFGLVQADIDLATATNFQTAAEQVAAAVVGDTVALAAVDPCPSGMDRRTCAQSFVTSFGAIAYRAPITLSLIHI